MSEPEINAIDSIKIKNLHRKNLFFFRLVPVNIKLNKRQPMNHAAIPEKR